MPPSRHAVPAPGWAAAADGELEAALAREGDHADDVGRVSARTITAGPAVDRAGEHPSRDRS